jgi:site-specific DNA recombinase
MARIALSYGRTSKETDDAFSVMSQHERNKQYADEIGVSLQPDFVISEDYTGTVMDRPALAKVRKLMRQRAFDVLIIYQTDRLARKVGVADFLLDEIFAAGVELHIVSWGTQVKDTPDDRTRFHFEAMFGDRERRLIKERTQRGMQQKRDSGLWIGRGHTKYGYRKEGRKREQKIVIEQNEAATILALFILFVEHDYTTAEIAEHMNAKGVLTPSASSGYYRKAGKWNDEMVRSVLREPAYTGYWYDNRFAQVRKDNGKKSTRVRDRDEWQLMHFPDLRIVSDELFTAAQEKLDRSREKFAGEVRNEYLMARQMTCGNCKRAFLSEVSWGKSVQGEKRKYLYYRCNGTKWRSIALHGKKCDVPVQAVPFIDGIVWGFVDELTRDPEAIFAGYQKIKATQVAENEDILADIDSARAVISGYNRELTKWGEMYAADAITLDVMKEKRRELDRRKAAAEEVIADYERSLNRNVLSDRDITDRINAIKAIRAEIDRVYRETGEVPFDSKRRLVEVLKIGGIIGTDADHGNRPYIEITWHGEVWEEHWLDLRDDVQRPPD